MTWRRIQTPTKTTIRSLAADASGRIYVGAVGDLGYIEPDEHGETRFVSLLDKVPADVRVFEDVWRTFAAPEGIYFQTQIGLFRWADGVMKVWKPTGRIFNRAQFANDTLYIGQAGGVLMKLRNDVFEPVPGAERMGTEAYPIIIPYDETRLLMGTRAGGLFLYDGATMRPFATDADAVITTKNLYRAFNLPNGSIALATTAAGVVILDRQGRLLEHVDQSDGLLSPSVYYLMPDREGGLWLALAVGLARVEAQSPFSLYGPEHGLRAAASDLRRHDGRLYIAHGQGVQYLAPRATGPPELLNVTGVANQCWAFKEFVDPDGKTPPQLLLTASDGLYRVTRLSRRANRRIRQSLVRHVRRHDVARGPASHLGGTGRRTRLAHLGERALGERRTRGRGVRPGAQPAPAGRWHPVGRNAVVRAAPASRRRCCQRGRASPGPPRRSNATARSRAWRRAGPRVIAIADKMYVGVLGKTAVFDPSTKRFVPDTTFDVVERDEDSGFINFTEGPDGRIYVSSGRDAAVMTRQADGSYSVDRQLFSRFSADRTGAFYAEKSGVLWFGTGGRLARFDTTRFSRATPQFAALLRRITINQSSRASADTGGGNPPALARGQPIVALRVRGAVVPERAHDPVSIASRRHRRRLVGLVHGVAARLHQPVVR